MTTNVKLMHGAVIVLAMSFAGSSPVFSQESDTSRRLEAWELTSKQDLLKTLREAWDADTQSLARMVAGDDRVIELSNRSAAVSEDASLREIEELLSDVSEFKLSLESAVKSTPYWAKRAAAASLETGRSEVGAMTLLMDAADYQSALKFIEASSLHPAALLPGAFQLDLPVSRLAELSEDQLKTVAALFEGRSRATSERYLRNLIEKRRKRDRRPPDQAEHRRMAERGLWLWKAIAGQELDFDARLLEERALGWHELASAAIGSSKERSDRRFGFLARAEAVDRQEMGRAWHAQRLEPLYGESPRGRPWRSKEEKQAFIDAESERWAAQCKPRSLARTAYLRALLRGTESEAEILEVLRDAREAAKASLAHGFSNEMNDYTHFSALAYMLLIQQHILQGSFDDARAVIDEMGSTELAVAVGDEHIFERPRRNRDAAESLLYIALLQQSPENAAAFLEDSGMVWPEWSLLTSCQSVDAAAALGLFDHCESLLRSAAEILTTRRPSVVPTVEIHDRWQAHEDREFDRLFAAGLRAGFMPQQLKQFGIRGKGSSTDSIIGHARRGHWTRFVSDLDELDREGQLIVFLALGEDGQVVR